MRIPCSPSMKLIFVSATVTPRRPVFFTRTGSTMLSSHKASQQKPQEKKRASFDSHFLLFLFRLFRLGNLHFEDSVLKLRLGLVGLHFSRQIEGAAEGTERALQPVVI